MLLFGYSLDGAPPRVIDLARGADPPEIVQHCMNPYTLKRLQRRFWWYCLSRFFGIQNPPDWLYQWRDTMLHSLYCGYPASLGASGKALGLPEDKQKLAIGAGLIRYFCKPCKPSKTNGSACATSPAHEPEKWELFKQYNAQDVVTEMEIDRRLSPFVVPDFVQKQWQTDLTIAARGVAVDIKLVDGALALDQAVKADYLAEAGAVRTGEPEQRRAAYEMAARGNRRGSRGSAQGNRERASGYGSSVGNRTADAGDPPELGKTSNKKYKALATAVCADGRVRGMLQF